MTFTESMRSCFEKYSTFDGRASRSEFWWFTLALILFHVAVEFLDPTFFGAGRLVGVVVRTLLLVFLLLSWAAVGFRRLHDIGWPGWPFLVPLTMSILWGPSFFLMWFIGGDARPSSDLQFAVAQIFAFIFMATTWATLPAWAVLAFFFGAAW